MGKIVSLYPCKNILVRSKKQNRKVCALIGLKVMPTKSPNCLSIMVIDGTIIVIATVYYNI